jgi:hypothetical protein
MGMRNRVHNIVMPIFWKSRRFVMTAYVTLVPRNEPLGTVEDLRAWFDTLTVETKTHGDDEYAYTTTSKVGGGFWVSEYGDTDFNREIVEPGTNPTFIRGCVGIRFDDDFWTCAAIPYRFRNIPGEDIISVIYPGLKREDFNMNPDSGSPEQEAFDQKREQDHIEYLECYELWRAMAGKDPDD